MPLFHQNHAASGTAKCFSRHEHIRIAAARDDEVVAVVGNGDRNGAVHACIFPDVTRKDCKTAVSCGVMPFNDGKLHQARIAGGVKKAV